MKAIMLTNIKYIFSAISFAALVACGGGGGDSSTSTSTSTGESNVAATATKDYTSPATYPVSDTAAFRAHTTSDVFKLSDGSAWQIVGTSNQSYSTGRVVSKVTISLSNNSTPAPAAGVRSNYYLVGDGITPAFYVNPLPMPIIKKDTVVFSFKTTGDIFKLSDGSSWQIVGTSNPGYSTGNATSKVVIYSSTINTPAPVAGVRSEYYLIGDDITPAFYIKPI